MVSIQSRRRTLLFTLLWVFCFQGVLNVCFYWGFQTIVRPLCNPTLQKEFSLVSNSISSKSFGVDRHHHQQQLLLLPNEEYHDICIVSTGLFGAIIAERFANLRRARVLVFEQPGYGKGKDCAESKFQQQLNVNYSDRVWGYFQSYFSDCLDHGCQSPLPHNMSNNSKAAVPTQITLPPSDSYSETNHCSEFVNRLLNHSLITRMHGDLQGALRRQQLCGKVYFPSAAAVSGHLQSPTMLSTAVSLIEQDRTRASPPWWLTSWATDTTNKWDTLRSSQSKHKRFGGGETGLYDIINNALALFEKDTSTLDLIVSRCGENVKWIQQLQEMIRFENIYIYNKCKSEDDSLLKVQNLTHVHVVNLPNVGREGATWLHHMLRTDIELASQNIFVQGKSETKRKQIQSLVRSLQFAPDYYHFFDLSRHPSKKSSQFRVCWSLNSLCAREYNRTELCEFLHTYSSTGRSCQQAIPTLRGEFYVTAEAIRRNILVRRGLFEKLLEVLNRQNDPPFGHHLERCWGEILGG